MKCCMHPASRPKQRAGSTSRKALRNERKMKDERRKTIGVRLTVKAMDPFSLAKENERVWCMAKLPKCQGANLPQRAREGLSQRYVGVNRLVLVRWSFGATIFPRRMSEPLAQLGASTS